MDCQCAITNFPLAAVLDNQIKKPSIYLFVPSVVKLVWVLVFLRTWPACLSRPGSRHETSIRLLKHWIALHIELTSAPGSYELICPITSSFDLHFFSMAYVVIS